MGYGVKIDGQRPKSKKAVKEMMKENPQRVTFDNTSLHGEFAGCTHRGDLLPIGLDDTIVGPDPYSDRKWYGQIKVTKKDNVKIS